MTDDLVSLVLRGILGGRPKRSRNALRFLTRSHHGNPLTSPSTLLAAAGVAWGIYETLQNGGTAGPSGFGMPGQPVGGAPQPPAPLAAVPPVPGAPPSSTAPDDVMRVVRLAVSAAHADGVMTEKERAAILQHATSGDAAGVFDWELSRPRPLAEIVRGVDDPAERATLYVLAYTILRADEQISGTERIYLAQLANLLGLGQQLTQTLEKDTGDRIDALGDQGQLGG